MSRHLEKSAGTYEEVDQETQSYVFNQTMLRIKDPKISLDFYKRIIGMKLYRKIDFPDMQCTLYFLGMPNDVDDQNVPKNDNKRTTWTFSQRAILELTHNWDTNTYEIGNGFGPAITKNEIKKAYEIVKNRCSIKAVGGIKSFDKAIEIIEAGATCIGTSFGFEITQEQNKKE